MTGILLIAVPLATALAMAIPADAGAATEIGATFPGANASCPSNTTVLQSGSPGGSYAAPSGGVITSWSFQAAAAVPSSLRFKVGRPAGGDFFTIVGESPPETPTANALNTYTDVRIPVQAGDVIGFWTPGGGPLGTCARSGAGPAFIAHDLPGDAPPGPSPVDWGSSYNGFQYNFSALLEPDADNDGFGDETQDQCVGQAGDLNGCPPLETTITKGPKDKTKKKQATFEFSADLASATFECSLDGGAFAPCSSPHSVKVKKGKHTFQVRAAAKGQTDATPASDDWKVKKKKKKKK